MISGCPIHPQSFLWQHQDGDRCGICGYFFDGREAPPSEPSEVRSLDRYQELTQRTSVAWKDGLVLSEEISAYVQLAFRTSVCNGEVVDVIKKHVFQGHSFDLVVQKIIDLNKHLEEHQDSKPLSALSPEAAHLIQACLGLVGEVAEFVSRAQELAFGTLFVNGNREFLRQKLIDEAGDIAWYLADAASALGVKLSEVATRNEAKLRRRYPDGFSKDRSVNRAE